MIDEVKQRKIEHVSVALGQDVATLRGHSAVAQSLVWSPDGHSIFTASGEATVWIWHAPKFEKSHWGNPRQPKTGQIENE